VLTFHFNFIFVQTGAGKTYSMEVKRSSLGLNLCDDYRMCLFSFGLTYLFNLDLDRGQASCTAMS
jgi:hypothetical protein